METTTEQKQAASKVFIHNLKTYHQITLDIPINYQILNDEYLTDKECIQYMLGEGELTPSGLVEQLTDGIDYCIEQGCVTEAAKDLWEKLQDEWIVLDEDTCISRNVINQETGENTAII